MKLCVCRIRAGAGLSGGGNCLKYFKKRWDGEVGIGNKNVKIGASWVKVGDSLKKE